MPNGSESMRRREPGANLVGNAVNAFEAGADAAGQPVEIGEISDTPECRSGDDVGRYLEIRSTEPRSSVPGQLERAVIGRPSPCQTTHRRHGIK